MESNIQMSRSLRKRCQQCRKTAPEDCEFCQDCSFAKDLKRKPYYMFDLISDPDHPEILPGVGISIIISPDYHEDYGLKRAEGVIFQAGYGLNTEDFKPGILDAVRGWSSRGHSNELLEIEAEHLFKKGRHGN